MKKSQLISFVFLITLSLHLHSQNFDNLNFGTHQSLDILTWNTEWFPTNGQTTVNYIKEIVEALDADIIAMQEIDNKSNFQDLINSLNDYDGYYISNDSYQGLAYLYKKSSIQIIDRYEIYPNDWNEFPRSPLVIEFNFDGKKYVIINNHLKCCGDGHLDPYDSGDEEARRYWACNMLDTYIEDNFPNDRVIVLGDLNDVLTDNDQDNVFQVFLEDPSNYLFADMQIAIGNSNFWSYPTWPSHLDHILITNELFDVFRASESSIETILLDEYFSSWNTYENNVSDHRPVGLKLFTGEIGVEENLITTDITISPNPFSDKLNINTQLNEESIQIYNQTGQLIEELHSQKSNIEINTANWETGLYFITTPSSQKGNKVIKIK